MNNRESGFTMIEIVIAMAIIGILTSTAVPAYRIYAQKSELTVAETNLRNGLRYFAAGEEYHPATGALDELVLLGYLPNIPNDPWTSKAPVVNGTEEVGDWFYSNDGQELILYALSGRGQVIRTPSMGDAAPGTAQTAAPAATAPVSKAAAKKLARAASWTKKVTKAQAQLDTLATTLANRQATLAAAQAAYAANASTKNKKAVSSATSKVNSTNKTIAKVGRDITRWQTKSDKLTAQAALL